MFSAALPLILFQSLATTPAEPLPEPAPVPVSTASARMEQVEVRAAARQITVGSINGISSLDASDIAAEAPTHPNELFDQVPGTWISRGSGQESLVAIRSPVLTGPGACGAFMVLEDRVPIRPAGFCNVNELFEVNLLQASRVDVVRGPGSAIYGSNALHGVIDVSSSNPEPDHELSAGISVGTDDYYRGRFMLSGKSLALYGNYTSAGSFRDDESFEQAFLNGVWDATLGTALVTTRFAWTDLDQDTAGFIVGENAFEDEALRTQNLNPEAFRKASALRVSSRFAWQQSDGALIELTPYLRSSDMDFLQHFLPGKPLESNGQDSAGLLFSWSDAASWSFGADLEWADGYLLEFQENPTEGSAFLMETRPQGFHYDYDVRMLMGALWGQYQKNINDNLMLTAGLRGEIIHYDYRNNMLDGNTRDDGTECGFGGCLYTRPADRSDQFDNLAPELGLNWAFSETTTLLFRVARGFRPPQATELYRLQRGQTVADLDSETLDSVELGLRGDQATVSWDLTAFAMRKDNVIFRDADGFNVSDGKTDHYGIEARVDWQLDAAWRLSANGIWAQHEYAFDRPESGIVDGNVVDTAPAWLAGAQLSWTPLSNANAQLEWVHQGSYYLDPANLSEYGGHDLLNARAFYQIPNTPHQFSLRITNLLDEYYAERADFAFGEFRYFPGAGRRYFLEYRYAL